MREKIKKIGTAVFVIGIIFILKPCIQVIAETSTDEFTYTVNDTTKEATITGYTGTQEDIIIPSKINGYKVTEIGLNAFSTNYKFIKSFKLPSTLKIINPCAFELCVGLTEVEIPYGCTTIKGSAFADCASLQKITIPSSVITMEYIDSINDCLGGIDKNKLKVYTAPESVAQTYMETYKSGYQYYYLDEYSPTSLEFSNPTITLNVGDTYTFSDSDFAVLPSTAFVTMPSSYTTSDQYVAYVSDGVLTARSEGSTLIKAAIGDEHLENSVTTTTLLTVKVVENRKKVECVSLNVDDIIEMYVGDTLQLQASVTPNDATYTSSWGTTNNNVVSVSDNGLITALSVGTEQVGYDTRSVFGNVYENNGKYVYIMVLEKPTSKTPLTPSPPESPTDAGDTDSSPPENTDNSEDIENIESTDNTDKIEKIKEGKITLNANKFNLQKGKSIKTLTLASNELEGDKIVNVTSSNKKIVKASLNGQTIVLKGIKAYKKYVTVSVTMLSGATATCRVKVINSAVKTKKLILSDKKLTLMKGERYKLTVTKNPISATDKITYQTNNKKVATVDKNGKIKAKKKGKATITVISASGKKAKCTVSVK